MKNSQLEQRGTSHADRTHRSVDTLPDAGSVLRRGGLSRRPRHPYLVPVPEPMRVDTEGPPSDTQISQARRERRRSDHRRNGYLDRILVRKARRMVLVRTDEILLIRASGNYVEILTNEAKHLLRSPMSELAEQLDPDRFLRVHRSTIINTDCLEAVETNPAGDYFLRLEGDRRVKCSRSYRSDLRAFLSTVSPP